MADVKEFPTRKYEGGLVPLLTELLNRATKGEIQAVACAIVYTDGDCGFMIPANDCHYKLLGSIYAMGQELHHDKIVNG